MEPITNDVLIERIDLAEESGDWDLVLLLLELMQRRIVERATEKEESHAI